MNDQPRGLGRRKLIRWTLMVVVLAVVVYFFARALITNWDQVQQADLRFSGWWIVATLLFAVAVPVTGLVWGRMLRRLDPGPHFSALETMVLQSSSWLLKYIPGQVGSVVNKVMWGAKRGISRMLIAISFVYENVFLQLVSIIPAVIILMIALGPAIFGENLLTVLLPLAALVPFGLILWKPFFRRLINIPARRVLKQEVPEKYFLSGAAIVITFLEFIPSRMLNGVGFVILASTVVPVEPTEWLPLASAYVLAGAIGILVFFVPSGLGVREAIIVLIRSAYMTTAEAIVIALLARLISTVGDAVVALFYVSARSVLQGKAADA